MTVRPNAIAGGHAGWLLQFRFAVHVLWPRVPDLVVRRCMMPKCSNCGFEGKPDSSAPWRCPKCGHMYQEIRREVDDEIKRQRKLYAAAGRMGKIKFQLQNLYIFLKLMLVLSLPVILIIYFLIQKFRK